MDRAFSVWVNQELQRRIAVAGSRHGEREVIKDVQRIKGEQGGRMTDGYDKNKRQARMETDMAWCLRGNMGMVDGFECPVHR